MGKEEIKKLVEDSKSRLDQEFINYESMIKNDLASFKKKTLDKI